VSRKKSKIRLWRKPMMTEKGSPAKGLPRRSMHKEAGQKTGLREKKAEELKKKKTERGLLWRTWLGVTDRGWKTTLRPRAGACEDPYAHEEIWQAGGGKKKKTQDVQRKWHRECSREYKRRGGQGRRGRQAAARLGGVTRSCCTSRQGDTTTTGRDLAKADVTAS